MAYQISRGGQIYGPYTLEDLQRYVASGNIQPTDLAKNEDLPDWVPVSRILGATIPVFGTQPAQPLLPNLPSPPDLHWGLLILFSVLSCGIFSVVWNLILASWFNKVEPRRNILHLYIAATILFIVEGAIDGMWRVSHHSHHAGFDFAMMWAFGIPLWINLVKLASWLARLFARFSFRAALIEHFTVTEPIGVRFDGALSGFLVFFFGCFYFQYKMNEVNEAKRALYARGAIQA